MYLNTFSYLRIAMIGMKTRLQTKTMPKTKETINRTKEKDIKKVSTIN